MSAVVQVAFLYAILRSADVFPRSWLVRWIRAAAFIETFLSRRGRGALAEARVVMGVPKGRERSYAVDWLSATLTDLVDVRRVAKRRENLDDWTVEEDGGEEVRALLARGASAVIATGHFGAGGFGLAKVIPETFGAAAVDQIEPRKLDEMMLASRMMRSLALEVVDVVRPGAARILQVGKDGVFGQMFETLEQGGLAALMIDAPWSKRGPTIRRPFAGRNNQSFALGAAALSRLVQVPIVLCVPERTGPQSCVLHWGPLLQPVPRGRDDLDEDVMNTLLDRLEYWIGMIRTQFPYAIGWERRWDPLRGRWFDPAESPLVEPVSALR